MQRDKYPPRNRNKKLYRYSRRILRLRRMVNVCRDPQSTVMDVARVSVQTGIRIQIGMEKVT